MGSAINMEVSGIEQTALTLKNGKPLSRKKIANAAAKEDSMLGQLQR